MKLDSADGVAPYMENLRAIDLYATAAESRGPLPGSQAGVADLFSSLRDRHRWAPSAYWHWNLRMQVAANLGAGLYDLNEPYFDLYRSNLARIEAIEDGLQAWVTVDREGALEAARQSTDGTGGWQAYLGESKELTRHRPLAGVTVGIKDIIDVAGLRTGLGADFAAYLPQSDAVVVKRLKDAGAIVLGKTHTTQFAASDPAPTTM